MIAQSYPVATRTPLARIALFAALCLVVTAGTAFAQSVPTGYQEYYVLGHEQHMWDMMDKVQNGQGGAQFANGMNSVVTATASADNQVVYYDHWEDGFEADIFSPIQISRLQKPHALIEAVQGVIRVDHQRFIQHSERFIPSIHGFEHIGEIAQCLTALRHRNPSRTAIGFFGFR